ncbi:MAG: Decarbamoylnovobiocin carbamoyltransferase [Ignavibacteriaceae bacterium]|nr:Decarbamoylnovobiocin carbamoyltransferase [Ignavibacteriaceae bacterium]GJQ43647.1 MAG: nodulation protein [Ignavibacteriaceae bacterium]
MYILGLNAYHGDSSACLMKDGKIINAIEEERIRRIKHWAGFPSESIKFCLKDAGITISDVDHITIGRNPSAHLGKKILSSLKKLANFQFIKDRASNIKKVTSLKSEIAAGLGVSESSFRAEIKHIEHHRSHLASAFFVSPFDEAAILSIDGFGDFSSTMIAIGRGNKIEVLDSVTYPHSLGIFYTAFTQFLGFPWYGDEYKVMGLSPYGEPKYVDQMKKIVRLLDNGLFELDESYFIHSTEGVAMTWNNGAPFIGRIYSDRMIKEFGQPRDKDETLTQYHKDLAASVQKHCEDVIFHILNHLQKRTGLKNICIAGGVAQNSVANGKVLQLTVFENIYIPSAGYDAGTAIGSAFWHYHQILGMERKYFVRDAYFGAQYSDDEIERELKEAKVNYKRCSSDSETIEQTAQMLADGAVIGWFQGRTEFGPRALGNRSVLVHPGRPDAKDLINSKIKRRESFRPFAPSILREYVNEYFEQEDDVYFMEKVFQIRIEKRNGLPAVTHVDGSGRLQTVHKDVSPKYYALIDKFREKTGLPILLNTSFNENEPIVNHPKEAIDCFLRTEMDAIVLENCIVTRNQNITNK